MGLKKRKPTKAQQIDAAVAYALASPYTAEIVREILMAECMAEFYWCGCYRLEDEDESRWIRCKEHKEEYKRRTMDPPRSCACGEVKRFNDICARINAGKPAVGDEIVSYETLVKMRRGHRCKAPTPPYLEWRTPKARCSGCGTEFKEGVVVAGRCYFCREEGAVEGQMR